MGIGNVLRSDDGAGPALAGRLSGRVVADVMDAGDSPERCAAPVRRLGPDTIVVVDAVRFGGEPGEVSVFSPEDIVDLTTSTHDISLSSVLEMIGAEAGARVIVVGIQPETTRFGENLSKAVSGTLDCLESVLLDLLGSNSKPRTST